MERGRILSWWGRCVVLAPVLEPIAATVCILCLYIQSCLSCSVSMEPEGSQFLTSDAGFFACGAISLRFPEQNRCHHPHRSRGSRVQSQAGTGPSRQFCKDPQVKAV